MPCTQRYQPHAIREANHIISNQLQEVAAFDDQKLQGRSCARIFNKKIIIINQQVFSCVYRASIAIKIPYFPTDEQIYT